MWSRIKRMISVNVVGMLLCVAIAVVFSLIEPLDGLTQSAMRLMGIFISTIVALIIVDYPISMVTGLSLCVLALTNSLQCQSADGAMLLDCSQCNPQICHHDAPESQLLAALQGFSNDVNWLVFCAFHIGTAVEYSNLGKRVSLLLMKVLGSSVLGLGYAVMLSELILAPFVPSNTARGGGIVLPIVYSIATTLGSFPDIESRSKGGEFLILVGAHANLISASLYPTGMAANPIVSVKARQVFDIEFGYLQWVSGSLVPGLLSALIVPYLLYRLSFKSAQFIQSQQRQSIQSTSGDKFGILIGRLSNRIKSRFGVALGDKDYIALPTSSSASSSLPQSQQVRNRSSEVITDFPLDDETSEQQELEDTAHKFQTLRSQINSELGSLGPLSIREWKLIFILVAMLTLWLTKNYNRLDTTLVAFIGLMVMLFMNVISWDDVIRNYKSLDTLFWLGILIMMANQLSLAKVSDVLGIQISRQISQFDIPPIAATIILATIYFYSMYMFSSLTGHILAFVGPFMNAGKLLNPGSPFLTTALLAYFSTLSGCLTNFSSGPIVIYFSQGYCKGRLRWFGIGLTVSFVYIIIYFSIGLAWWKVIGWW
ncbi:hypothetical protein MIR68_009998 [Amoeboaphelidium protococcarum]|nr:hypothetical protein MIR68_009998 [Amoeboaphelidium protococcarum]